MKPKKINNKFKASNFIQEIQIDNFNNNTKLNNLSINSTRNKYYKKRPFYFLGKNNFDKNETMSNKKFEVETPNNNNKIMGMTKSFSKNFISLRNMIDLGNSNILENIRKRNRPKQYSKINSLSHHKNLINNENNNNIENNDKNNNNENNNNLNNNNEDNDDKNNGKINNINNINNNISLNNKYNFFIKIGKNNINKENKDLNYEINLASPIPQEKDDISSHFIKKVIVEYDMDKFNKNINLKDNKKEINVNINPLYKKIEIKKIQTLNDYNKNKKNKTNNITRNNKISRQLNKKSLKFLIHQAYNNRKLSYSFNKCYDSRLSMRGRSLSNHNNKNFYNDPFNYSNIANETLIHDNNKSLSINYFNNGNMDFDENGEKIKKYKNFFQSFRIAKSKRENSVSSEENKNRNKKNIGKVNNLTCIRNSINSNNVKNNNLELTLFSDSISNINGDNTNSIATYDNFNTVNYINIHSILNSNRVKGSKVDRMFYNLENANTILKTPERMIPSKINSSFTTFNSNLNSLSNTCYKNNNINSPDNNILSISPTISTKTTGPSINLEILYVLEEKLKIIIDKITNYQRCSKECYDYINYYFNHNFYSEELKLFKSEINIKIINNYIKNALLCYFLCYDISYEKDFKQAEILLKGIFILLYKNYLKFLSLIISDYKDKDNNIIIILKKIVKDNIYAKDLNENSYDFDNMDENKYIEFIENDSKKILDYYNMIIENLYVKYLEGKNENIKFPDYINIINSNNLSKNELDIIIANFFIESNKSLEEYNYDLLKKFFYSVLYYKQSLNVKNDNLITPKKIKTKKKKGKKNNNLLPKIKNHKYTLVLDLDETLISSQRNFSYRIKSINNNININLKKNKIILRPGLHEFLNDMKLLFELVIFSSGAKDYVDPIIKMIEKDEKYFDYILYRQHITTDENGDNVKNLELIGRDLKNVIIIDDIAKYFKLQKENGICIKPFCGNILSDRNTLKILSSVLKKNKK